MGMAVIRKQSNAGDKTKAHDDARDELIRLQTAHSVLLGLCFYFPWNLKSLNARLSWYY